MIASAFSLLVSFAVIAAFWLLPKYLERRVAEAARGAVDVSVGKTLADYYHQLDRQLEVHRTELSREAENWRQSLALDRERFSKDYELFAGKRNEVYADTYSLFERARGGYARHFAALTVHQDFRGSPEADLRHLAKSLEFISEGERAELVTQIDRGDLNAARKTANVLHERDAVRQANRVFVEFRNACVVHALWFSKEVDDLLEDAVRRMALLSVFADELIEGEKREHQMRRDQSEKVTELDMLARQLRKAMRHEMQAAFANDREAMTNANPGSAAPNAPL